MDIFRSLYSTIQIPYIFRIYFSSNSISINNHRFRFLVSKSCEIRRFFKEERQGNS